MIVLGLPIQYLAQGRMLNRNSKALLDSINDEMNMEYYPGKIEKKVISFSDGRVYEWVGCEIAAGGILVAGKIDKKVIIHPNGDRQEWVNCQIDKDGNVIEESVVSSSSSSSSSSNSHDRPNLKRKRG